VLVLERRDHIGGNAYSVVDAQTDIEYHKYGSHIFHTSNKDVWEFLNKFSSFNSYRHRVFARHKDKTFTMPINLMTINQFFGLNLDPAGAKKFLEDQANNRDANTAGNLEDRAISLIGRPLYEAFIKNYTAKQWETPPSRLPPEIITRLPVRYNFNDFYFSDMYEGLPLDGYTAIFDKMFAHEKIQLLTRCDFFDVRPQLDPEALILFTGPMDRYFEYKYGELGWRTLDFEIERMEMEDFQGAAVMNYVDADAPYTRIHEFKHLHQERKYGKKTLIMKEFSRFARQHDEPYYPIGLPEDKMRYEKYRELAVTETNVIFGGRLGTYRYLDMHQAIGSALRCFKADVAPRLKAIPVL
jgi:UDP-galactopyranose mutase